jgi:hypothetical protein
VREEEDILGDGEGVEMGDVNVNAAFGRKEHSNLSHSLIYQQRRSPLSRIPVGRIPDHHPERTLRYVEELDGILRWRWGPFGRAHPEGVAKVQPRRRRRS